MDTVLILLSIPLLLFFPGWAILSGRAGSALRMTIAEKTLARVLAMKVSKFRLALRMRPERRLSRAPDKH